MRPYIAILKDSFREALASRVLWVTTGLIGVFLLLVVPLGYKLNLTGEITWGEIMDGPQLAARLRRDALTDQPSPGRRIWSLLDDATREKVQKLEKAAKDDGEPRENRGREFRQGMDALRTGLNTLIARRDFYQEDDWRDVSLPKEAKDYLARSRESLSMEELARMNRLLIEAPYQSSFAWRSPDSVSFTYFWLESDPWPFSKKQIDSAIKEWVLTTAMQWIVGVFGIITAIVVTSTVIPQMFEPGSITLLLSKPVSRSLLLTAKFFGACAFVLLNATFLITGLWLIAGLRFEIWNSGMLWSIPIFMFMFLVYYTVSALTGLVWKSAIVSVVCTVLFYVTCWVVDTVHEFANAFIIDQHRITRMIEAEGTLLAVNEAGELQTWDDAASTWRRVSSPRNGNGIPTIDGPYYHAPSKHLLVGQGFLNPFGFRGHRITLRIGSDANAWQLRDGPATPSGSAALIVASDQSIFAVASDNVFRFHGDLTAKGTSVKILGMRLPLLSSGEFRPCLTGERPSFPDPLVAAADPQQARIVVCAANNVFVFSLTEAGELRETARRELKSRDKEGSAVAMAGETVVVAREHGKVLLLSASDLSVKRELELEGESQPRYVSVARDGSRFAVVFQNRRLWMIDASSGAAEPARIAAQGEISGAAWTDKHLLIGDYANRVVAYDAASLRREKVYRPAMTRWEWGYYYVIQPLHTIFPKPRKLNKTVQYVLTGKRTTDGGLLRGDLRQQRDDLHPWEPVQSGLVFVGLLLLGACVYFERQEF
jgi:hypothetical protein